MSTQHQLVTMDYAVIVMMLLISIIIGFKFRLSKNEESSAYVYLMAGKNMFLFPVILSISVTLVSGSQFTLSPAEIYRYDFQPILGISGLIIGIVLATNVFIPVYFRCGVSTIYEYLEMRFGKVMRYFISAAFILQMAIVMSICLFPPVLALNAVTNLSIELSIVLCGLICTFYCLMGGLKGVLWTDSFQCVLMFIFLITVYITSIPDAGGIKNAYQTIFYGGKLDVDFSLNLTKRYTFWSMFTTGIIHGFGAYGANQIEVQRALSLKNVKRAKLALYIGMIPLSTLYLMTNGIGLMMYALYSSCDPVYNKNETGVLRHEQLVPYYVVNRFSSMPGMTGLLVSGIFSGTLSTISSALNSFATVAVLDFVQPLSKSFNLTNSKLLFIAKILTLLFGLICTALPFLMIKVVSIKQLGVSISGLLEGPMTAVFAAGVLSRKVSEKCALVGFFVGFIFSGWIAYGSLLSGYYEPFKNLGTNCTLTETKSSLLFDASNSTCSLKDCFTSAVPNIQSEPFVLYKIAFTWIRQIGFLTSIVTMLIGILITGWNKDVVPWDSVCLSPVTRFWNREDAKNRKTENYALSAK